jgi:hypothetical protein
MGKRRSSPTRRGRNKSGPYITGNELPNLQFIALFVGAQFIAPVKNDM